MFFNLFLIGAVPILQDKQEYMYFYFLHVHILLFTSIKFKDSVHILS